MLAVLGMHRSGTSAVTRILSLLGADLPIHLLGGNASNEPGHWESTRLIQIHDEMLAEGGSSWNDWRDFDLESLGDRYSYYRDRIAQALKDEFGNSDLFVVKDPRICRFFPLYEDISRLLDLDIRCIIPYRKPVDVAASLAARGGTTGEYAKTVWARHVLDAVMSSQNFERVFISFDDLIDSFEAVFGKLESFLRIDWPINPAHARTHIESFLKPALRHHNTPPELSSAPEQDDGYIQQILANLRILDQSPHDEEAMINLSLLHQRLNQLSNCLVDITFDEFASRQKISQGQAHQMNEQLRIAEDAITQRQQLIEELRVKQASVGQCLQQLQTEIESLQVNLGSSRSTTQALNETLVQLQRSYSWKITYPLRIVNRLLGVPTRWVRRGSVSI